MSTEITEEAVQQTLQGYLATATKTGELRGVNVEFTADGETWHPLIFGLGEGEHPLAARARVHREGWAEATDAPELWEEVVPAIDGWRDLWFARPHVLFGAHALRVALRRTFADVLGERREPDDLDALPTPPRPAPADAIDWAARIAAAETLDDLNGVRAAARGARAMTLPLKDALDARRAELTASAASAWEPTVADETPEVDPERPARPEPKDHLPPQNRAERRAATRKKGRRR